MSEELDVTKLYEIDLYFIINEIGGFIWRMNHEMLHGRIEKEHWAFQSC